MHKNIFIGKKVRLVVMNPEKDGKLMSIWRRDSEYARLLDSDPVRLWSGNQMKDWFENKQKRKSRQKWVTSNIIHPPYEGHRL